MPENAPPKVSLSQGNVATGVWEHAWTSGHTSNNRFLPLSEMFKGAAGNLAGQLGTRPLTGWASEISCADRSALFRNGAFVRAFNSHLGDLK